jgi:osmotically-inducible protein OsmY
MKTWTRCFMLAAAISTLGGVAVANSVGKQSNAFLEDTLRDRLADEPVLKGSSIQVAVADRVVTLTGCAASNMASNKAAKIARSTAYVKSVTNKLRIRC